MSKFGELIDGEKPILLVFYEGVENEDDGIHRILNDVAEAVGDKVKIKVQRKNQPQPKISPQAHPLSTLSTGGNGGGMWEELGGGG